MGVLIEYIIPKSYDHSKRPAQAQEKNMFSEIGKNFCLSLVLFESVMLGPASATEIKQGQLDKICYDGIGLRSGQTATDVNGAGYGMDNDKSGIDCLRQDKGAWSKLLDGTLTLIKGFPGSEARYLLIVEKCRGLAADYPGAFPKCNSVTNPKQVLASTLIGTQTEDQLRSWVLQNIPSDAQ